MNNDTCKAIESINIEVDPRSGVCICRSVFIKQM